MGNPYKELRRENDNLMEDLSIAFRDLPGVNIFWPAFAGVRLAPAASPSFVTSQ